MKEKGFLKTTKALKPVYAFFYCSLQFPCHE